MRGHAVALSLVLAGLGCRGEADLYVGTTERTHADPGTFYVNNYDEPQSLDPGLASDRVATVLIDELFEGLVVLHPDDLHPTPGIAVRYDQSDDNRLFRFHLRPEAKWSDGQPLTAEDFVYSWGRVLDPKTGARMATMLYRLKNGQLYHQGKLKVLTRDERLRAAPRDKTEAPSSLAAHSAVRVLRSSPVELQGAIAPVTSVPTDLEELSYQPPAKDHPEAEQLVLGTAHRGPTADSPWQGKPVAIEARGPAVRCNHADDYWYRLALGEEHGFAPGCMLRDVTKPEWVLVERFDDLPTFQPAPKRAEPAPTPSRRKRPRAQPPKKPVVPNGWVRAGALASDPAVLGVRAPDEHTLEVELAEPTPYFLELASYATLFPVRRDLLERFAAEGRPDFWYRPENIIVNGPYTLDRWTFRYEIRMKVNPHYYGRDKLKTREIVWLEVADQNASMNLYQTGEIDYIGPNNSIPSAYMERLEKKQDFRRSSYLSTYWYELNVRRPPLDDVRVRRALNLGIDKRLLVERITRGGQQPATHYVPDFTGSGYAEQARADAQLGRDPFSGRGADFDPEHARELLAEAGYPVERQGQGVQAQGFPPLQILYNTGEGHRKIAVAIQDMWKQHLGITVSLRNEEWKVMLKNIQTGNYQVARAGWVADYNHPHTWMETFLSYSDQNWTGWKSPEFDHLVEQAAATADTVESIRLYREAERLALAAVPRIPLYFFTKSTLVKPYVKGYYDNPMNQHLGRYLWIDPDWQRQSTNEPAYPIESFPPPGRI